MNRYAMRRPSPVLSTPRDMKKAQSTSQTSGSAYPESASRGVIVFVMASAATPRKTTAPAGTGRTIDPTIVAVKIAKRCHDSGVIPEGTGIARIMSAELATITQRRDVGMGRECTVWIDGPRHSTGGKRCFRSGSRLE